MSEEVDLLDELGPSHDAEECQDRPCDWHLAMMLAADVKRLTAERDEARSERDWFLSEADLDTRIEFRRKHPTAPTEVQP